MKVLERFQKLLPLAMAAALVLGGKTHCAWAAPKVSNEKPAAAKAAKLIDINTATAAELEEVPESARGVCQEDYRESAVCKRRRSVENGYSRCPLGENSPAGDCEGKVDGKGKAGGKNQAGAAGEKTATTSGKTANPITLVDINTATAAELEEVSGIGPTYAKKIIANRPYVKVEDLSKAGIPASRLEKIIPLVTVTQQATVTEKPAAKTKPAGESSTTVSKVTKTGTYKPAETTSVEARTPPRKGMVWVNRTPRSTMSRAITGMARPRKASG